MKKINSHFSKLKIFSLYAINLLYKKDKFEIKLSNIPYSYAFVICSLFNILFEFSNIDKDDEIISVFIKHLNNFDKALNLGKMLYESNSSFISR